MNINDANKGSTIMRATEHLVFEPLVDTLVERNSVGMIVAPAKAKKSMLALNLVFSLLTKKSFLGLKVSSPARTEKIIYINLELTKTALGVHFKTYTHDVGLQALAETLAKLEHPLKFQSLKVNDSTYSSFLHRWKMQEQRNYKNFNRADSKVKCNTREFNERLRSGEDLPRPGPRFVVESSSPVSGVAWC